MTINNAPIWEMAILDKPLFLLSYGFIIAEFNSWHGTCIVFHMGQRCQTAKNKLSTGAQNAISIHIQYRPC
jgi:hypothetical protein